MVSPDFLPRARCNFSHARKGKRPFQRKTLDKGRFPFSRGRNRISRGVENRGSLISVPLALSPQGFYFFLFGGGEGGVRGDREGGRGRISTENLRRGGGFPRTGGGGARGPGGYLQKIWGGGAKYSFSGPKCPSSL